jgi:hypothetical protein
MLQDLLLITTGLLQRVRQDREKIELSVHRDAAGQAQHDRRQPGAPGQEIVAYGLS